MIFEAETRTYARRSDNELKKKKARRMIGWKNISYDTVVSSSVTFGEPNGKLTKIPR